MKKTDQLDQICGPSSTWRLGPDAMPSSLPVAMVFVYSVSFSLLLQFLMTGPILTIVSIILGVAAAALLSTHRGSVNSGRNAKAAQISHDLRTQLGIIQLQLNAVPDPRVRRIEEDIRALTAMVDEVALTRRDHS